MAFKILHPPRITLNRDRVLYILLTLVAMFIPVVIAMCLCSIRGYSLFDSIPVWQDDETWYYQQYKDIAAYGSPLGYFGYAGTHADVGTWGPWGMFPVLFTGFFARIFGWGLHSFVYYNFFYLAAGMLIFILLTKPSLPGLIKLTLTQATAYVAICYATVCMNECARYAFAMVLMGVMYRIYTVPEVSRIRFILRCTLVPLLLIYAMLFYRILCAFIPIYVILMLRRWKLPLRVLAVLPVMLVVIKCFVPLNSLTCCPYIVPESSQITLPTRALQLSASFYSFLNDTYTIDPFRVLAQTNGGSDPFLTWFCILLYVLMVMLVLRLIAVAGKPEKKTVAVLSAMGLWLLLSFWGGHLLLYSTANWTFLRGCYTCVYCVVPLLCLMPKEDHQPWLAAIAMGAFGVFSFMNAFVTTIVPASHFSTEAQESQWAQQAQELAEVMVMDQDAEDPWSNTVVLHNASSSLTYLLPAGAGINGAAEDSINENARYVILGQSYSEPEEREADIQELLEGGHEIILDNNSFTLFENKARTFG